MDRSNSSMFSSVKDHSFVKGPMGDVAFDANHFKIENAVGKFNSMK